MKSLFVIAVVCGTLPVFGQSNNTNTNTNTVPATTNGGKTVIVTEEKLEEAPAVDSAVFEREDKKLKASRPKEYYRSIGVPQSEQDQVTPAVKDTQSGSASSMYSNKKQEFQTIQTESSHNAYCRSASPVQQKQMNESLELMNMIAPDAYETNLFNYQSQHYNSAYFPYLKKAAALHPDTLPVRQQLAAHYFSVNESMTADSVITQMVTDGNISSGQMTYAFNLGLSVGATNTIVVHGFDDFLPLSHAKVQTNANYNIVSLDLLQSDDYRSNLAAQGYAIPASKIVDTAFLADFVTMNQSKNIQLSMTLPRYYLESFLPNLYPQGLTFVLKDDPALTATNIQLWEKLWNKAPLKSGGNDKADQWSTNYLPALVMIKRQYELNGQISEANKVNEAIIAISERRKIEPKIKKYTN